MMFFFDKKRDFNLTLLLSAFSGNYHQSYNRYLFELRFSYLQPQLFNQLIPRGLPRGFLKFSPNFRGDVSRMTDRGVK